MRNLIRVLWPVVLIIVLASAFCQFNPSNAVKAYHKLIEPVKRLAHETEDERIARQYEEIRKAENLRIEEYVKVINGL